MKFSIDDYAHLNSPIHRWEPRCKLVALFVLMLGFAMVHEERAIPMMLLLVLFLVKISRLPVRFLFARMRYPGVFVLAVILIMPLSSGDTAWFSFGPFTLWKEGTLASLLIISRFVTILTTSMVLFGTAPFLTTIYAMQALGIPSLLTDMMLFFYRYLQDTADRLTSMQTAMRLRGFGGDALNRHTLGALASLVGTLLIRSAEQSERIYRAMRLRGYGQPKQSHRRFQAHWADWFALVGVVGMAIAVVLIGSS